MTPKLPSLLITKLKAEVLNRVTNLMTGLRQSENLFCSEEGAASNNIYKTLFKYCIYKVNVTWRTTIGVRQNVAIFIDNLVLLI